MREKEKESEKLEDPINLQEMAIVVRKLINPGSTQRTGGGFTKLNISLFVLILP